MLLSKSLAGAVAVALMAAWMTPSTRPKPLAPSPLAGLSRVKPMELSPETAADAARAAMPPPSLAPDTLPPEMSVKTQDAQPAVLDVGGDEQSPPTSQRVNAVVPATAAVVEADVRDGGRTRYREGYKWASDRRVEEARECPSSPGDPAQQGCLDYASDQDRSSDDHSY